MCRSNRRACGYGYNTSMSTVPITSILQRPAMMSAQYPSSNMVVLASCGHRNRGFCKSCRRGRSAPLVPAGFADAQQQQGTVMAYSPRRNVGPIGALVGLVASGITAGSNAYKENKARKAAKEQQRDLSDEEYEYHDDAGEGSSCGVEAVTRKTNQEGAIPRSVQPPEYDEPPRYSFENTELETREHDAAAAEKQHMMMRN